jgi:hypothetical protein
MKDWIKKSLTGHDNVTFDPARLSWLYGLISLTALASVGVFKGMEISLTEFATSLALVNAAGAGSTIATNKSQPQEGESSSATRNTTTDSEGLVETTSVETNSSNS